MKGVKEGRREKGGKEGRRKGGKREGGKEGGGRGRERGNASQHNAFLPLFWRSGTFPAPRRHAPRARNDNRVLSSFAAASTLVQPDQENVSWYPFLEKKCLHELTPASEQGEQRGKERERAEEGGRDAMTEIERESDSGKRREREGGREKGKSEG